MSEGISFNSKIDLWLLVVLLLGVTVCLLPALQFVGAGGTLQLVAIPLFLMAAFLLWLLVSTRYLLLQHEIRIRFGPLKWTVPIKEITAVTPTRNALSGPALSLDRIRIDYGKGRSIMISPEPRQEFLRQLQARRS